MHFSCTCAEVTATIAFQSASRCISIRPLARQSGTERSRRPGVIIGDVQPGMVPFDTDVEQHFTGVAKPPISESADENVICCMATSTPLLMTKNWRHRERVHPVDDSSQRALFSSSIASSTCSRWINK